MEKSQSLLFRIGISLPIISFLLMRFVLDFSLIEDSIYEMGLTGSWQGAIVFTQIISILEITVLVLNFTSNFKKGHFVLLLTLSGIYLTTTIFSLLNVTFWAVDLSYIGIPLIGSMGVFIMLSLLFLTLKTSVKPIKLNWLIPSSITIIAVCIFLILGPLNLRDFTLLNQEFPNDITNWSPVEEALKEKYPDFDFTDDYIIFFFDRDCIHCIAAAKRLGIAQRKNESTKAICVFFGRANETEFWESDNQVESFFKMTSLASPFIKIKDYKAVSIAGGSFPCAITMSNGLGQDYLIGPALNPAAFDFYLK